MWQPLGFEQRSINTSLGRMVYYTATGSPWQDKSEKADRETLLGREQVTVLAVWCS